MHLKVVINKSLTRIYILQCTSRSHASKHTRLALWSLSLLVGEFVPLGHHCAVIDIQLVDGGHVVCIEGEVKHVQILFNVAWSDRLGDDNQLFL